jgi:hypothetical protein
MHVTQCNDQEIFPKYNFRPVLPKQQSQKNNRKSSRKKQPKKRLAVA